MLRALGFTIQRVGKRRHVSGQELLAGILEYARGKYGPLGAEVFFCWGVLETLDFGQIVWDLIDMKLLARRQEDRKEDFRSDIDLTRYFEEGHDYLSSFQIVKDSTFSHVIPKESIECDSATAGGNVSAGSDAKI